MSHNEQFMTAVSECETVARARGHTPGAWYPIAESFHAYKCEVCGAMAWVTRPSGEKRWRIGGSALERDCLEDDQESASGA